MAEILENKSNNLYKSIPFTKYDVGWVILCIGMAIGSGIVFMPVQVGIKGIWVFIVSVAISYPAIYIPVSYTHLTLPTICSV